MKNIISIILYVFICTVFTGCCSHTYVRSREERKSDRLEKRTDRLIKKCHNETDTVFLYSIAFNDFNFVWYHKDNHLYGFIIEPYSIERLDPVEAENISLNDDIDKYFEGFVLTDKGDCLNDSIPCFPKMVLDGAWIMIYVKNKEPMHSSIEKDCLFSTNFKPNSFPYKLQYDFYKLRFCPKNYNFEEMYSE